MFWLFIPGGREPEKQGQRGWGAWELESVAGGTRGSLTLRAGWQPTHFSLGQFSLPQAHWVVISLACALTSNHILNLMVGGSCVTAHQIWLPEQCPAHLHKTDIETTRKPTLPREYLQGHVPVPAGCPPPTLWFLQLYSDTCLLSSYLAHQPSL